MLDVSPPRNVNDDWRIQEMLHVIELVDPDTSELGITGGEPKLLRDGMLRVIEACKTQLPDTALHVLSNGRLFRYDGFSKAIAALNHPDLIIGIPGK